VQNHCHFAIVGTCFEEMTEYIMVQVLVMYKVPRRFGKLVPLNTNMFSV